MISASCCRVLIGSMFSELDYSLIQVQLSCVIMIKITTRPSAQPSVWLPLSRVCAHVMLCTFDPGYLRVIPYVRTRISFLQLVARFFILRQHNSSRGGLNRRALFIALTQNGLSDHIFQNSYIVFITPTPLKLCVLTLHVAHVYILLYWPFPTLVIMIFRFHAIL